MKEIESFYRIHDVHPNATGYFPATPTLSVSQIDSAKYGKR